jgi:hypothetical protein
MLRILGKQPFFPFLENVKSVLVGPMKSLSKAWSSKSTKVSETKKESGRMKENEGTRSDHRACVSMTQVMREWWQGREIMLRLSAGTAMDADGVISTGAPVYEEVSTNVFRHYLSPMNMVDRMRRILLPDEYPFSVNELYSSYAKFFFLQQVTGTIAGCKSFCENLLQNTLCALIRLDRSCVDVCECV